MLAIAIFSLVGLVSVGLWFSQSEEPSEDQPVIGMYPEMHDPMYLSRAIAEFGFHVPQTEIAIWTSAQMEEVWSWYQLRSGRSNSPWLSIPPERSRSLPRVLATNGR